MSQEPSPPVAQREQQIRLRAVIVSLVVSAVLLVVKFGGYVVTGSTAVLSDALESIVNVFAAAGATWAIRFGAKPADRNHPYGHGKIEFVSAAFEGGLIAFAAVVLFYQAGRALLNGVDLRDLDLGIAIVLGAGLVNAALGLFLIRVGRRYHSLALVADGQHVLSDFWTSVGVGIGLALVRFTGIQWFDPVLAGLVAIRLAWTGAHLVRQAMAGLLDEEDPAVLEDLVAAMNKGNEPGVIRVHKLRAMRAGRFHHIDAHLVMPEFWDVETAHAAADRFEREVISRFPFDGEIEFHTDPCRREYCDACTVSPCPVRREPLRGRPPLTVEEVIQRDPPQREEERRKWIEENRNRRS